MGVRAAAAADVDDMVRLADKKRRAYEQHAPVFHCPARTATEIHRRWLETLISDPDSGTFVFEDDDCRVTGFVIIAVEPAPPVYDPGGPSSHIDDFAVDSPDLWMTAGYALLDQAKSWALERGAVQIVVVCGPQDKAKRDVLTATGLYVASEWFTGPLRQAMHPD